MNLKVLFKLTAFFLIFLIIVNILDYITFFMMKIANSTFSVGPQYPENEKFIAMWFNINNYYFYIIPRGSKICMILLFFIVGCFVMIPTIVVLLAHFIIFIGYFISRNRDIFSIIFDILVVIIITIIFCGIYRLITEEEHFKPAADK